ncbi:MAG TPA: hypothetical protein PLV68_21030, partial [Ilumatobacteraceae bacterium]|nr:hypothetical protein [Ilumatobacteraceae bacterium]
MTAATAGFRASLRDLAVQAQYAAEQERVGRRAEHPSIEEIVDATHRLSPLVWTRRPSYRSFATVRLGLGDQPSRNTIETTRTNNTLPELWREMHDVVRQF